MIPNVTKGTRVRGLLEYLWGRGKREEHTNPHLVAGYDEPDVLTPPAHPTDRDRVDLAGLAARLDAPQAALGERGLREYVFHCSLSVTPQERALDDADWRQIAERFVALMGFAGDGERAGCRWVAVHHGLSENGNDHIHLVVTRATEDGAPVWLRGEWKESQRVADQIETEFGLLKLTPGRDGATARAGATQADVEQARRAGRPVPDRTMLRREVRAALAGARGEADWVARMRAAGLLVATRTDPQDTQQVVGYAVALRPAGQGKARWLSGRLLDGDLSLRRVRTRWAAAAPLSADGWKAAVPSEARVLADATRIEVWRSTAAALQHLTAGLAEVPVGSPEWPAIARASADTLARVAAVAEPSGAGPVSAAADVLARAAAPKRTDPPAVGSRVAAELGRVADALLLTGGARNAGEAAVVLAVVVQAARLVVALAELRTAQQELHAAGAARAAAARLMPLLQQASRIDTGAVTQPAPAPTRQTVRRPPARPGTDRLDGPRREDQADER